MALLPVPSDRDEWLRLRRDYIGGSEAATLLGMQAGFGEAMLSLYLIKRGEMAERDAENERTREGQRQEHRVAVAACEAEGWGMLSARYAVDDTTAGMAATLDRIIVPTLRDEIEYDCVGHGALECKWVSLSAYKKSWHNGEPPPYYLIQLQHQLACSGFQWGALAASVYRDGTDEVVHRFCERYQRHDDLIETIRSRAVDFWDRVRTGRQPEDIDGHPSTRRALQALFPRPLEKEVDLTGDNRLPGLCTRHAEILSAQRRLKEERDEIENTVRSALGEAKRARVAGGIRISRSVGENAPDRVAKEGELIKGRKGADRLKINVPKDQAE